MTLIQYSWEYADEAARLAATEFAPSDVGKLCRQLSDNSIWILTATTPVWVFIGVPIPELVGPEGPTGPAGAAGVAGAKGDTGPGVPIGGTAGQVLAKIDGVDYNDHWIAPPSSGGSGDVVGPSVSVGGSVPIFDGITGKLLKDLSILTIQHGTAAAGTGGTITDVTVGARNYKVHTFTGNGTFVSPIGVSAIDILIAAGGGSGGGGAGGNDVGGGGGSGGVLVGTLPISPGSYPVVVGAGGAAVGDKSTGNDGQDSSFNTTYLAKGGGGGGRGWWPSGNGNNGGSGGGGGGDTGGSQPGGSAIQGSVSPLVGHGANGADGNGGYDGGVGGGASVTSSISGSSVTYANGGGNRGQSARTNVGDGGGGNDSNGVAGGNGVVIIRYELVDLKQASLDGDLQLTGVVNLPTGKTYQINGVPIITLPAMGTEGQVLKMVSGVPTWVTP